MSADKRIEASKLSTDNLVDSSVDNLEVNELSADKRIEASKLSADNLVDSSVDNLEVNEASPAKRADVSVDKPVLKVAVISEFKLSILKDNEASPDTLTETSVETTVETAVDNEVSELVLIEVSDEIATLASAIFTANKKTAKSNLLKFVHKYVDYDFVEKTFVHHDYFKMLKKPIRRFSFWNKNYLPKLFEHYPVLVLP